MLPRFGQYEGAFARQGDELDLDADPRKRFLEHAIEHTLLIRRAERRRIGRSDPEQLRLSQCIAPEKNKK